MLISVLGEIGVHDATGEVNLPPSKKARALLGFLATTGRPHRRERLCEMFWDLPDDPKAALRWTLTKLRKVVDAPDRTRIVADRERVRFDGTETHVDLHRIQYRLNCGEDLGPSELGDMADRLGRGFLEGLDGAGDRSFDAWLAGERADVTVAYCKTLRRLAEHPDTTPVMARKWRMLWRDVDPDGTEEHPAGGPRPARGGADPASPRALVRHRGPPRGAGRGISQRRGGALRAQKIGFCKARDGATIAYATIGSGPPLLKAANWLSHLEFDWSSPIWGRSFAEIARHRTFIRYDERGCGLSDWNVADLSFNAFVDDLEAIVDTLGLDRFPLLGISQGAAVSIEYAVRHPDKVSGLILVGGYAAGWRHLTDAEEQARREAVMTLTELGWGTDDPTYRHIFSKTFMPGARPQMLDWFDDFQRQTTSPRNAARFQHAFGDIDVRERLGQVRVPTIVFHSRYDQRIPLEVGRALASGIPNAQFVPLDSRNHILVEEEPAWLHCVAAAGAFLAQHGI
jgi:pimeloyl-ACP methyl ester carboxylesterase